jgi:hypothetical protein
VLIFKVSVGGMVTNQSVSNRVDPDSVGALVDWFQDRHDFPRDPRVSVHDIWAHLLFGFATNYRGELYAGVSDSVLSHLKHKNSLIDNVLVIIDHRPSLEEVKESLVEFHGSLSRFSLEQRYDPWTFRDSDKDRSPEDWITQKIHDLYVQYGVENNLGVYEWSLDDVNTSIYYKRRLIPPEKRLPPELFDYAEKQFGSMPSRDEEAVNGPIVDPEEMKRLFPQYAAGMRYFCGIIHKYYRREPFEETYNRVVSQESREFIAEHEGEILAVFSDMEAKVQKAVSSLGDVKTLEPLSPERIEELYDLCVRVDEYIKEQTGQYPHKMTLEGIRELPMSFLSEIQKKFPWPHFEKDQPSFVGGADDPRLVFDCLLAEREEYGG